MRFWKRNKDKGKDSESATAGASRTEAQQEEVVSEEVSRYEAVNEEVDAANVTAAASSPVEDAEGTSDLSPAMQIRDRIVSVIKTVYDPEIPVDIYELGLVYGIEVTDDGEAHITMTLTSPMCPVAETLPPEVEDKVRGVVGVKDVNLDLVWDPPWTVDMMSDAARLDLNMM